MNLPLMSFRIKPARRLPLSITVLEASACSQPGEAVKGSEVCYQKFGKVSETTERKTWKGKRTIQFKGIDDDDDDEQKKEKIR